MYDPASKMGVWFPGRKMGELVGMEISQNIAILTYSENSVKVSSFG